MLRVYGSLLVIGSTIIMSAREGQDLHEPKNFYDFATS